ncbi:MAG: Holliday junction branch migration protein RuvA [Culicoidibacterales bacterium]
MYASIEGTIQHVLADRIIIKNSGIGYNVFTPYPYDFTVGSIAEFMTYTHVREDQISLFGFKTLAEKDIFVRFLQVKGIGPKAATAILGSTTVDQCLQAVAENDVAFFKKIPGIGPKSAQQIILDLQGKLAGIETSGPKNIALEEAIEALLALGYSTKEVERVKKVLQSEAVMTVENYIKKGLQVLLK